MIFLIIYYLVPGRKVLEPDNLPDEVVVLQVGQLAQDGRDQRVLHEITEKGNIT